MRRALSIICASALLFAGLWLIGAEFLHAEYIAGRLVAAAAFMVALGGYWLWSDLTGRQ